MTDTIRKAVELADGWEYKEGESDMNGKSGDWIKPAGVTLSINVNFLGQIYIDALAAQLMRQVNKLGPFPFVSIHPRATVAYQGPEVELSRAEGIDQAANTLKVIVDSGLLEMTDDELNLATNAAAVSLSYYNAAEGQCHRDETQARSKAYNTFHDLKRQCEERNIDWNRDENGKRVGYLV